MSMALNTCLPCLLAIFCCGLAVQENPMSVELSCGAGPIHVVLEPPQPLLLDCHLGITENPLNLTWLKDGLVLSESEAVRLLPNGSLLLLPSPNDEKLLAGMEGAYSCMSRSSFGRLTSRSVALQLARLSSFLRDPEPQVVAAGGTARFECQIEGVPAPSITWEKNHTSLPVPDASVSMPRFVTLPNGILQILAVTADDDDGKSIAADVLVLATNLIIPHTLSQHAGVYVCRANKPKTREFVSAAAEIHVLAPPVIIKPPESVSLSRGNTARFVCNSSGSPPASLLWLKDGERLQWTARVKTQSPGVLLINQLRLDDAGYYQCLASNVLGTACATAKLSVIVRAGLPSPPLHLQATPHSSNSILLTWDPPEHNREQVIGFSIHYQRATAVFDNMEYQFAVNNDTTEFHVKELQPHTAYTFYMVAYSPMGASRPSQSITVETVEDADDMFSLELDGNETQVALKTNHTNGLQTTAKTRASYVLLPPAELKVTAKMHSLYVTWQPPANHTQITGYKLAYREAVSKEAANQGNPASDATHIRLRKRVKHYEITGLVRPLDHPPPLPPSIVKVQSNSSTSIWLRWEKPAFSNIRIINYTIRCSPAGNRNASLVSYYTSTSQEILLGALKPFTRYELAIQSNGVGTDGPFSSTVEESTLADRPSSPPTDLQLSAIDSFSVLVSWRPPLEPNGIIIGYRMLYSGNLSQPDDLWTNLSRDGSVTSTEVQGLLSGTRYYFKMGACTEVGVGPFSPVKDVHTPPKKYDPRENGSAVGLLTRTGLEAPGGLKPSMMNIQYRRSAHTVTTVKPNCTDCHELQTLMPPGAQDQILTLKEPNEQQSLMGSVGEAYEAPVDVKPSWNGSVSREWASQISSYRETIPENVPCLVNGAQDATERKNSHEEHLQSLLSRQVEADVIVHSELSDPAEDSQQLHIDTVFSFGSPVSHVSHEEDASPLSISTIKPDNETHPVSPHTHNHVANQNGTLKNGLTQLSLGGANDDGVSPEQLRGTLENGDHRLHPSKKVMTQIGLSASPQGFARSGLVHSTSGAHNYLCS
ncbi:Immunoglobulin superfamily DCC subclass member 4 [Bagarius yarrelli]|nr:Immunoglobulin superfamily DCC subclass member 4 [Bagarius yarrelli]